MAKEEKDRITKIDWKNDNLNKFKEVKKASKDGKDTLIFVKGKENYIENMNRNIENWIDINEVKVVDCYDINEIKDDVSNIAKKYNGNFIYIRCRKIIVVIIKGISRLQFSKNNICNT